MSSRMCRASLTAVGSRPTTKPTIFAIAITLAATIAQPFAIGSDKTSNAAGAAAPATKAAGAGPTHYLQVDDIQDLAHTLQRIRQQAINIYVEATRPKTYRHELNVPCLSSMPTIPLKDQNAYLPLRPGWLMFFIGTMEPLVQILNEDLKHIDEKTERSVMSSQDRSEWQGIVNEWKSGIHELNDQLNVCASLLDDAAPGNVEVAKAATSIDSQVSTLDHILHKACTFLDDKLPDS